MLPWQQPANFASPSSFDPSSLCPRQEDLFDTHAIVPNVHEDFLFHGNDIVMQINDGIAICSSLEDQLVMAAMPDCNYSHGYGFTDVGIGNVEDECSLDFWENLIEPTSQSQTLTHDASSSISPAYFSSESSGTVPTNTNTPFVQPSPVYSEASSVAACQHDSHAPYINNHLHEHLNINPCTHSNSTNCMRTSLSPHFCETSGYSEVSSVAAANQHDPFNMSNHSNDHLGIHMGMYQNATNTVHTPMLPNFGHGSVHITYSGSPASNLSTSDDDFFGNEASSFRAFASPPPYDLNSALSGALNLEVRASRPQLNLEARASLLHEASSHSIGAIRNSDDCESTKSGESVSFLVETGTPAIEDGYVWRKYGQKSIKDKLHPRSYFKCAQPTCSVKKQTESSSDMQGFVLFTYFGRHNH